VLGVEERLLARTWNGRQRVKAPDHFAATERRLLVVDDSEEFCSAMRRAFEQRGYSVRAAHSAAQAREVAQDWPPEFAVVDLRLPGAAGLSLIPQIKAASPAVRLIVLTGYASIATAVEAIKLGATHYLTKPVEVGAIEHAFRMTSGDASLAPVELHPSVDRLAWEHIQRVLAENCGNISATARALKMHRRTLQRKLGKFPTQR